MGQVVLGADQETGRRVKLPPESRIRGTYVIGIQGSGKTNLLIQIALADIERGDGVCVLSPHPDLVRDLLQRIPQDRHDDVVVFNPADEKPVGVNVFEWFGPGSGISIDLIADQVVFETFKRLWADSWGPRMEEMLYNVSRTILYGQCVPENHRPTLAEFAEVVGLYDTHYRDYLLEHIQEQYQSNAVRLLAKYWDEFTKLGDRRREEIAGSTLNKARPLAANELVAHVVGQGQLARFDFRMAMAEAKIVLVDLDIDKLGSGNVELLGSLVVGRLFLAAISRGDDTSPSLSQLKPFHIIADEFGFFATPAFAALQDQARKFGVDVLVAHQRRGQLDTQTRDATLSAGNRIVFTVNSEDAKDLAPGFDRTPPGPELRGEREPLAYASYPWDALKRRAHELPDVTGLVHTIDGWLSVDICWDMADWIVPRLGIDEECAERLLRERRYYFQVWGFPNESARDRFEKRLNTILYLMMTDAPGHQIEPHLLMLGVSLFRYRKSVGQYWPIEDDPPLASDWGESALEEILGEIKYGSHDGYSGKWMQYGNAQELGPIYMRLYLRNGLVTMIATLGSLLRDYPVWARGGQPEPDYEAQRTYMDVTAEWENILTQLPKFEAWCRIQGVGEFHIHTQKASVVPANGKQIEAAIRQLSRNKHGVDRQLIDQALRNRVQLEPVDEREDEFAEGFDLPSDW